MTHLRQPYYRPSFMGGDTQHPKCMAPRFGWAGFQAAALPQSDDLAEVTCELCLIAVNRRPPADEPAQQTKRVSEPSRPHRSRRGWSLAKTALFIELASAGALDVELSEALGRSLPSIRHKRLAVSANVPSVPAIEPTPGEEPDLIRSNDDAHLALIAKANRGRGFPYLNLAPAYRIAA